MKEIAIYIATIMLSVITPEVCAQKADPRMAQNARAIMDRTAQALTAKNGATAHFTINSAKTSSTSGTIAVKGNKFNLRTNDVIIWFDGKTQYTYLKTTDEVTVTNAATSAHTITTAHITPLAIVNLYKKGYDMTSKIVNGKYQVHLTAQTPKAKPEELFITVNPKTYTPTQIRMLQNDTWVTIDISNFKASPLSDNTFIYEKKQTPGAEIVDLR